VEVCHKATWHGVAIMEGTAESAVAPTKSRMSDKNIRTKLQCEKNSQVGLGKSRSRQYEH